MNKISSGHNKAGNCNICLHQNKSVTTGMIRATRGCDRGSCSLTPRHEQENGKLTPSPLENVDLPGQRSDGNNRISQCECIRL